MKKVLWLTTLIFLSTLIVKSGQAQIVPKIEYKRNFAVGVSLPLMNFPEYELGKRVYKNHWVSIGLQPKINNAKQFKLSGSFGWFVNGSVNLLFWKPRFLYGNRLYVNPWEPPATEFELAVKGYHYFGFKMIPKGDVNFRLKPLWFLTYKFIF